MQKADGDAFDFLALEIGREGAHSRFIERQQHAALTIEPLRHGQAQTPGNQRLGQGDVEIVLVVAALVAQRQHVAKAFGRDESRPRALALDDRVGRQSRAVNDEPNVGWRETGLGEDGPHAAHHAFFRRAGRRQHLRRGEAARMFESEIREGAADIDGQPSPVIHATAGGSTMRSAPSPQNEFRQPVSVSAVRTDLDFGMTR